MISKEIKKELRKLLRKDYPTAADVVRVADDIDLSIEGVDTDANINTVWGDVLDKASIDEGKWNALVALFKDEMNEDVINAVLSNNISTNDKEEEEDSSKGVDRAIGGVKKPPPKDKDVKQAVYKNHLLIIGIDKYSNGLDKLNNALSDAKRFKNIMLDRYQFEESRCTFISDEEATRDKIISTFDELKKKLTKTDNLLMYFSGHGWMDQDSGTGYLIPSDGKMDQRSSFLSNDEIKGFFKGLSVQHTLAIVDACFSGSMLLRSVDVKVVQRYYNIPSRWVMTSGLEEPVPDGRPGNHSPFAESLLAHLESNTEEVLGISNLWMNIREGVIANSPQTPMCQPVQNSGHLGGEFFFLLKSANIQSIPKSAPEVDYSILRTIEETSSLSDLQSTLTNLVSNDKVEEVFEMIDGNISQSSRIYNTRILLQARYSGIQKDIHRGTVSNEHTRMELARIRHALLSVISDLDEDDLT